MENTIEKKKLERFEVNALLNKFNSSDTKIYWLKVLLSTKQINVDMYTKVLVSIF